MKSLSILENKYLLEASNFTNPGSLSGEVQWTSPANIALIKYWGKRLLQKPINPSLSFTLSECNTQTSVKFNYNSSQKFSLEFKINGSSNVLYKEKIENYLLIILKYFPFIQNMKFIVSSANSFPEESGIASSASSFAALALCICSIELEIKGKKQNENDFFKKASFMARLGSGSACRSVYGEIVLWGQTFDVSESTDETAIPVSLNIHNVFRNYRDNVLIVHSGRKPVPSTIGHMLMGSHPFLEARILQAKNNLSLLLKALISGDLKEFIRIVENESLTLHSLMLSSDPGYILLKPNTIEILERIRRFRYEKEIPICFSLDAGANVHLLFPENVARDVNNFVEREIKQFCEEGRIINDRVGNGPVKNI